MPIIRFFLSSLFAVFLVGSALAQEATVAFGTEPRNPDDPVEVTSQQLSVNEKDRTALFTGEVVVGQSGMRLFAPRVLVHFKADSDEMDRMEATGGVTLLNGEDEAEAERADYFLDSGTVEMYDNVLLKQSLSTISSDRMTANLDDGSAVMRGNVKSIFNTNRDN